MWSQIFHNFKFSPTFWHHLMWENPAKLANERDKRAFFIWGMVEWRWWGWSISIFYTSYWLSWGILVKLLVLIFALAECQMFWCPLLNSPLSLGSSILDHFFLSCLSRVGESVCVCSFVQGQRFFENKQHLTPGCVWIESLIANLINPNSQ